MKPKKLTKFLLTFWVALAKILAKVFPKCKDFISPCAFSNAVLHMQALKAWQSPNILAHKWGGGGGPPQGEFNGIYDKLQ